MAAVKHARHLHARRLGAVLGRHCASEWGEADQHILNEGVGVVRRMVRSLEKEENNSKQCRLTLRSTR
jgi:hypothetical protein